MFNPYDGNNDSGGVANSYSQGQGQGQAGQPGQPGQSSPGQTGVQDSYLANMFGGGQQDEASYLKKLRQMLAAGGNVKSPGQVQAPPGMPATGFPNLNFPGTNNTRYGLFTGQRSNGTGASPNPGGGGGNGSGPGGGSGAGAGLNWPQYGWGNPGPFPPGYGGGYGGGDGGDGEDVSSSISYQ